ncbi:MAG: HAD family hydrolase [Acidobacteria bacterium]|nr:MAG: HAD family hydrolase [Acidobacteriota bacterium]
MRLRAVLFDLDGTLIDSYRDIALHLNRTLRDFSMEEVDVESVRHMVGGGAKNLLKRFFSDGTLEEAIGVFMEYYMQEPVIHTRTFEGIKELLACLKEEGICMAVVTNKMEKLSREILNRLSLTNYFSFIVGGDTYAEKKPSSIPVLKTLDVLGIKSNEAIMLGDTEADITAGKLAGTWTGLAKWGYIKSMGEKPHFEFDRPLDLCLLLRQGTG